MKPLIHTHLFGAAFGLIVIGISCCIFESRSTAAQGDADSINSSSAVSVHYSMFHDVSPPLTVMAAEAIAERKETVPGAVALMRLRKNADLGDNDPDADADAIPPMAVAPQQTNQDLGTNSANAGSTTNRVRGGRGNQRPLPPPVISAEGAAVEQTKAGTLQAPEIVASFDGLGNGFRGPQGVRRGGNPSDNSLAVGPDHIVQVVNSSMAVFTKKGKKYDKTGEVLYGMDTGNVFRGFGDGSIRNNGDAVVRYDQLADRWLIVMPLFYRLPVRENEPAPPRSGVPGQLSQPGVKGQPGEAATLYVPPPAAPDGTNAAPRRGQRGQRGASGGRGTQGSYGMCYAISTTSDPLGSYYRYEFIRPLFPDYPRPAVWPDGYYVPTSTGDTVIQKQAFVVDRAKMLKGEDAAEQCFIIDGINFLNNADLDGTQLPPPGAPNLMFADGGTQLKDIRQDDGVYFWKYFVNWEDPSKTRVEGPTKIQVAPYHFLGGGQLTQAVPQPGTNARLDSQGDKLMSRVIYRRIGDQQSIVATHSIATSAFGGGVRWYEFRVDADGNPKLYQQSTYAPGGDYRWLPSPDMDSAGNIGIGYSFGGTNDYAGQRFAARHPNDPKGMLTLQEAVLAKGEAVQTQNRWEDYTTACMDPSDDRTIWYVGDYLKQGATSYSTRIGGFRIPDAH